MPNKSKSSRSKETDSTDYKKIFFSSSIGTAVFLLFIVLFALIALKNESFSQSTYIPVGFISAAVSSFMAGYMTVRPVKKNGALLGFLTGMIQALISSAVLFFINERHSGTGVFILMGIIVLFGIIGGISAVNIKVRKKYK